MRKIFILLVALIAVPAFALTVTLVDNSDGTVDVTYDATGDANQPRAFALTISVTGGATITSVAPAITGESDAGNLGFGIFPGTIDINGVSGVVTSYGSPVAPANDPGAAGTGIGTASVVLELGSLYVGAANSPPVSGTLATLSIDCTGASGDVNVVAVEEVQYRGGIVLEDGSAPDPAVTIAPLTGICAAGSVCPGDVTGTVTGLVTGPPPLFTKTFDSTLWTGSDGKVDTTDVQSLIYLLVYDGTSLVVSPVPAEAAAGDVTGTVTGLVTGPPPLFTKTFDVGLWTGPDGKIDTTDVQSLIYLLVYDGTSLVYTCP